MIRRYLLDTGIAQDFQDDRHDVRARADRERHMGHRIGICVPVLGELWAGIESASRDRNLQSLRDALSRLSLWPYSNEAAEEYGRIFAELRRHGASRSASRHADWGHCSHLAQLRGGVQGFGLVGNCRNHRRKLGALTGCSWPTRHDDEFSQAGYHAPSWMGFG